MNDDVHHPEHYTKDSGIECIDAIEAQLGREQFIGYLRGQVVKYTWRMPHKGSQLQDCQKAAWYLNRLIELLKSEE